MPVVNIPGYGMQDLTFTEYWKWLDSLIIPARLEGGSSRDSGNAELRRRKPQKPQKPPLPSDELQARQWIGRNCDKHSGRICVPTTPVGARGQGPHKRRRSRRRARGW